jgi:hypothetical protein
LLYDFSGEHAEDFDVGAALYVRDQKTEGAALAPLATGIKAADMATWDDTGRGKGPDWLSVVGLYDGSTTPLVLLPGGLTGLDFGRASGLYGWSGSELFQIDFGRLRAMKTRSSTAWEEGFVPERRSAAGSGPVGNIAQGTHRETIQAIAGRNPDPNGANPAVATVVDCNDTKSELHRGFYLPSGEEAKSILDGTATTGR